MILMNTPTHMIVSYALLRSRAKKKLDAFWIILGGLLPDLMIFVLFFYALLFDVPMREVWDVLYFTDFWQNLIDCFNSIPITIVFVLIAVAIKWQGGILLGASLFIHILGDIFLHNDDAHRHFFPLSDYKFISPVSYWDPDHLSWLGMIIEYGVLGIALYFLWPHLRTFYAKVPIVLYGIFLLVMLFASRFLFS